MYIPTQYVATPTFECDPEGKWFVTGHEMVAIKSEGWNENFVPLESFLPDNIMDVIVDQKEKT